MKPNPVILLIDDNTDITSTLSSFFAKRGYEAIVANNGLEGLKLLEAQRDRVDLIVTDLIMPYVSGVGVIAVAKKKYPEIPVIAITGWGEYPEALAAEAHADVVIEKPFGLEELDKSIRRLLKGPMDSGPTA
jgi:DNA-binding NtrC family response regulator